MARRRRTRKNCKVCGEHRDDVGPLSARGKCIDCANALIAANIIGIASHSGPFFQHWRHQMAASVGGVLLDEARARE